MSEDPGEAADVTRLLRRLRGGDAAVEGELLEVVYAELRALAARLMRGERSDHTLQATALVNEAWLRLAGADVEGASEDRRHFLRLAARTMRRVLVDHARTRGRDKRGGGRTIVALDDVATDGGDAALDVLDLEQALEHLEERDPELARVVELRYFAGMTLAETADALAVTEESVRWSWKLARAFLRRELGRGDEDS